MAITNFIPTVWSARLLHELQAWSVFYNRSNRNYEGDATYGNKVKIFGLDDDSITVKNYDRNADLDLPDDLNTSELELVIDQEKYLNFGVEDLDRVQARGDLMGAAVTQAARKVADDIDAFVLSLLTAVPVNDFAIHEDSAPYDISFTSKVKQAAMSLGLPLSALAVITTPNIAAQIDKAKITGGYGETGRQGLFQGSSGDRDPAENAGFYGNINNLDTFVSNQSGLIDTGETPAEHRAFIYDPRDLGLVVQVNKMEAYRPERRFKDAVKGLWNYGGKVLKPGRMMSFTFDHADI